MYGFNQSPSQRHAPSPGPGWTTLQVQESESEDEDEQDVDMLNEASRANTPAWGSQPNGRNNFPRPAFWGNANAAQSTRAGPSSDAPSQAQVLANTINGLNTAQPGEQSSRRTRYPGELTPWKARTTTLPDASRMPPPAFSASQLAKANGSVPSGSQPVASTSTASTRTSSSISLPPKPFVGKETARKSANSLSASQRLPSSSATLYSSQTSSVDKGKGKAVEEPIPKSPRPGSSSSFSKPSSSASRVAIAASGKSPKSKARLNRPATSSDDEFPDAATVLSFSQVSRAARKISDKKNKAEFRPPSPRKSDSPQCKKKEGSRSISSKNNKPPRPPPLTQPVRVKPGSGIGVPSISAPLPYTQPAPSKGTRKEGDIIVLSDSSDEDHAVQYLKKLQERSKNNTARTKVEPRQSLSSQRNGSPPLIDLTSDGDADERPHPPKQTARKSTVPNPSRRKVKTAPAFPQTRKSPGPVAADDGFIDLTLDDSPPRPRRAPQIAEQELAPGGSAVLVPPPPKTEGRDPSGKPSSAVKARQTARKTTAQSPPTSPPFTAQRMSDVKSSVRPRQTARKSTHSVEQNTSILQYMTRKDTDLPSSPKTSRRTTEEAARSLSSPKQPLSPRQTARKSTRSSRSSPPRPSLSSMPNEAFDSAPASSDVVGGFAEPSDNDFAFDEPPSMDVADGDVVAPPTPDDVDLDVEHMTIETHAGSAVELRDTGNATTEATGPSDFKGHPGSHGELLETSESDQVQRIDNGDSDTMTVDGDAEEVDDLLFTSLSNTSSVLSVLGPPADNAIEDGAGDINPIATRDQDSDRALCALPAALSRNLSITSRVQTPEIEEVDESQEPNQDPGLSGATVGLPHSQETVKPVATLCNPSTDTAAESKTKEGQSLAMDSVYARESNVPPTSDGEGSNGPSSSAPGPPDTSLEPADSDAPQTLLSTPKSSLRAESQAFPSLQSQVTQVEKPPHPRQIKSNLLSMSLSQAIQFASLKNSQSGEKLLKKRPELSLRHQSTNRNGGSSSLRSRIIASDTKKPVSTPLTMLRRRVEDSSQSSSRRSSVDISNSGASSDAGKTGMRDTAAILRGTTSKLKTISNTIAQTSSPLKRIRSTSASESDPISIGDDFTRAVVVPNASKRLRAHSPPGPSTLSSVTPRSSSADSRDDLNLFNARDRDETSMSAVVLQDRGFIRAPEYAPVDLRAGDIPHDLANAVNSIPNWYVNGEVVRKVFEAAMMTNTTNDESDAPYIRVINEVDDEPTPPFEFFYSNLMWHGDNVPKPDYSALKGCGCVGKCDPRDQSCGCLVRAKQWCERAGIKGGFMYDMKGRLKIHNYPIFECNELCGCDETCYNRVVQQGRRCTVNIVKTLNKGWGIFAGRRIPSGTFVGIYAGEIITDEEGERRGKLYEQYAGRTYLFDIDFWHIDEEKSLDTNYVVDAFHAGNFTRFLNHSCDPNCVIDAVYIHETNKFKPLMVIFTCRDVSAGEELCFSYFGDPNDQDETANVHDSPGKSAHMHEELNTKTGERVRKCECGAPNCRGNIFT